jgi:hypothetical protein
MESLKISIAIVTRGEVLIETMGCLIHSIEKIAPHRIALNLQKGTYIHDLRNRAFQEAVDSKADYLMFIDTDVCFGPEAIIQLVKRNKDIIGASYNLKSLPLISVVKPLGPDGKQSKDPNACIPGDEMSEVFAVATGFMLIKMQKVRKMKYPFNFGINPDGTMIGEDVNFCKRCKEELGLKIWCDPTIKVGHIGEYLY